MMTYYTIKTDNETAYVYVLDEDGDSSASLQEAIRRGEHLGGPYSAAKHHPHWDGGQLHIHVYKKGNQIFALNQDGTAHDRSHGITIPRRVADGILRIFPEVTIPASLFIEALDAVRDYRLTMEFDAS